MFYFFIFIATKSKKGYFLKISKCPRNFYLYEQRLIKREPQLAFLLSVVIILFFVINIFCFLVARGHFNFLV